VSASVCVPEAALETTRWTEAERLLQDKRSDLLLSDQNLGPGSVALRIRSGPGIGEGNRGRPSSP